MVCALSTQHERKTQWRRNQRKKVAEVAAEANWHSYFEKIRSVCPWSYSAWRRGAIEITQWHSVILDLNDLEARVYVAPNHKYRQLQKMAERFNRERPTEEWLWSHPQFQGNSAPLPCFIQQDRKRLETIRLNRKKQGSDK